MSPNSEDLNKKNSSILKEMAVKPEIEQTGYTCSTSVIKAVFLCCRSIIGIGVLAMPHNSSKLGFIPSILLLPIIAIF